MVLWLLSAFVGVLECDTLILNCNVPTSMNRVLRNRIVYLSLRPFKSKPSSAVESASCPTHTGQVFDQNDFRTARFMESAKLVNQSFAVDLISKVPAKKVTSHIACCDGGGGALGHPKVYINLDQPGTHTCGYCGLRFELAEGH